MFSKNLLIFGLLLLIGVTIAHRRGPSRSGSRHRDGNRSGGRPSSDPHRRPPTPPRIRPQSPSTGDSGNNSSGFEMPPIPGNSSVGSNDSMPGDNTTVSLPIQPPVSEDGTFGMPIPPIMLGNGSVPGNGTLLPVSPDMIFLLGNTVGFNETNGDALPELDPEFLQQFLNFLQGGVLGR